MNQRLYFSLLTSLFSFLSYTYAGFPKNSITIDSPSPSYIEDKIITDSIYTSNNLLDNFGSCPQVRNACKASDFQGSLIICGVSSLNHYNDHNNISKEEFIIVVSHGRKNPGLTSFYQNYARVKIVAKEYIDDNFKSNSMKSPLLVVTIGSGLKADFMFIVKLLRQWAIRTWERYDTYPSCLAFCDATRRIITGFFGYNLIPRYRNEQRNLITDVPDILTDSNENSIKLGRPMGVKVVIAAFLIENIPCKKFINIDKCNTYVEVRTIDPAGVVSDRLLLAVAMGKSHEKANALLEKRYHYGIDIEKMKIMLINIMREVLLETDIFTDNDYHNIRYNSLRDDYIVCEVVTKKGIINWEKIPLLPMR